MFKAKDITNQRFGNLIAKKRVKKNKHNEWCWKCDCDCGKETIASLRNLVQGNVKSCGKCNSLTFEGETLTVGEWARKKGIINTTLHHRIHDYNWSVRDALTKPTSKSRKNIKKERRLVVLAIENISCTQLARERGLGASFEEIKEYTKLTRPAIVSALAWLRDEGIIIKPGRGYYFISKDLPDSFCFEHGTTEQFGGKCLECLKTKGR